MFDDVAERYDLTNTVLSFGQDKGWRKATREALDLKPGEKVLDLAAGTGVSTVELGRSGAWCVATDFSKGMLKAGISRKVPMVAGDAMYLPYADNVFDAATISFGLRNVSDFEAGLREIDRPRGQCRESHDVEATDDGAIGCRQLFSRRSYVSQNLSTRADQAATGRTEHHAAPDAMEKPHSQFTFEPAQRL